MKLKAACDTNTTMSQVGETFFVSVGCMDGRVQDAVANFGRQKFGVLFADTVTEAGLVGLISKENIDESLLSSLKFKIADVSLGKHHAQGIVVHGHAECAGNPVSDEQQKQDILKSAQVIRSIVSAGIPIIPVFVKRGENGWVVEELL